MADDVTYQSATPATPPSGTVIATDEAGSPARQYQLVKLVDGTANSETPIVGVAAQPTGTETGLVVRPASVVPDVTASGTIDALNETLDIALAGREIATVALSGNFTGTLSPEVSFDGGVSWVLALGFVDQYEIWRDYTLNGTDTDLSYKVSATKGATHLRVRASAWTSGSVTVSLRARAGDTTLLPIIFWDGVVQPDYFIPIGGQQDGTSGAVLRLTNSQPASNAVGVITRPFLPTNGSLTVGLVDETGSSAVDAMAVGGGTPHDSVDSGNPLKMGVKAANALPTAVAANDRANAIGDLWGRQMVTHIDPAQQVWKAFNATSMQTGVTIWDPTSGKKIAITSIVIGTYGTTAGRAILWFGANGDTTYSAGTDQLVLAFSSAPSASSKPGLVFTPAVPIFNATADVELHITTDANLSIDVAVYGYEW